MYMNEICKPYSGFSPWKILRGKGFKASLGLQWNSCINMNFLATYLISNSTIPSNIRDSPCFLAWLQCRDQMNNIQRLSSWAITIDFHAFYMNYIGSDAVAGAFS